MLRLYHSEYKPEACPKARVAVPLSNHALPTTIRARRALSDGARLRFTRPGADYLASWALLAVFLKLGSVEPLREALRTKSCPPGRTQSTVVVGAELRGDLR